MTAAPGLEGWCPPPEAEIQLYRIVQEALTNARKHAAACCIRVMLACADGHARITVQDDGRGFEPDELPGSAGGFGLRFMRERAEQVGGRVEILSQPGAGTQVVVKVPLEEMR